MYISKNPFLKEFLPKFRFKIWKIMNVKEPGHKIFYWSKFGHGQQNIVNLCLLFIWWMDKLDFWVPFLYLIIVLLYINFVYLC